MPPTARKKPPAKAVATPPAAPPAEDVKPPVEDVKPGAAAAAAIDELNPPPDGMVRVPFRGREVLAPLPKKIQKSFRAQMAMEKGTNAAVLAAFIGEFGTRQIAALIDEDVDDFDSVVSEFFKAYGEVTGSGNFSTS